MGFMKIFKKSSAKAEAASKVNDEKTAALKESAVAIEDTPKTETAVKEVKAPKAAGTDSTAVAKKVPAAKKTAKAEDKPTAESAKEKKATEKKTEKKSADTAEVKKTDTDTKKTQGTKAKTDDKKAADTTKAKASAKSATAVKSEEKKPAASKATSKTGTKDAANTKSKTDTKTTAKAASDTKKKTADKSVDVEIREYEELKPEKFTGKFDIKKTKDGRFVFNLYSTNHVIVATSQVYSSAQSALVGINSVIANAHKTPIEDQTLKNYQPIGYPKWEIYLDKGGQYRFKLNASNGSCVCHSQGYTSKSNCKKGIESIIKCSRNPEIDKSYLKKSEE